MTGNLAEPTYAPCLIFAIYLCKMETKNNPIQGIQDFYQRKFNWMPDGLKKERQNASPNAK
jgi:hypothetical protein